MYINTNRLLVFSDYFTKSPHTPALTQTTSDLFTQMFRLHLFFLIIIVQVFCCLSTVVSSAQDPSKSIGCLSRCNTALSTISRQVTGASIRIESSCRHICGDETSSVPTLTHSKTLKGSVKATCCRWCVVTTPPPVWNPPGPPCYGGHCPLEP